MYAFLEWNNRWEYAIKKETDRKQRRIETKDVRRKSDAEMVRTA